MKRLTRESLHHRVAESYKQHHFELVEVLGRICAQAATNYRNEQPRTQEHIARQEEVIAMLCDVLDVMGPIA